MIRNLCSVVCGLAVVIMMSSSASAQPSNFNYDESRVPSFTLPDPLVGANGQPVTEPEQWPARRDEIVELFRHWVYGRAPQPPAALQVEVHEQTAVFDGLAIRRQVTLYFGPGRTEPSLDILLYTPTGAKKPPVFLALNFFGNHSIHPDPAIRLSQRWMRAAKDRGIEDHRATEQSRGKSASRWPLTMILKRNFAVATIYCGDIDPDFHDEFRNGVHALTPRADDAEPVGDAWGTITAWAWGLSRAVDYFEADQVVDPKRVIVMGHSRLGKTALWAAARDDRFAMAISNNSGCGGAALSRRAFGETVKRINTSFPHWFCGNFKRFNDRETELPVDQHLLVAAIAPRPVYIASAEQDRWADPHGEFLSARYAHSVYRLLGTEGLPADTMPAVNEPVSGRIAYHIRTGKHDVTDYDWTQYMDFADKHLRGQDKPASD